MTDAEIVSLALDWRHWYRRSTDQLSMLGFDAQLARNALDALNAALDDRLEEEDLGNA